MAHYDDEDVNGMDIDLDEEIDEEDSWWVHDAILFHF